MTKSEFKVLLDKSALLAFNFAKNYISNKMKNKFRFNVQLGMSADDKAFGEFDFYPEDVGKEFKNLKSHEVVELLVRNQKVPVWIDISVKRTGIFYTTINLICAGRYTDINESFYYIKNGTGPFGIKSPNLPFGYKEGMKFKLK